MVFEVFFVDDFFDNIYMCLKNHFNHFAVMEIYLLYFNDVLSEKESGG